MSVEKKANPSVTANNFMTMILNAEVPKEDGVTIVASVDELNELSEHMKGESVIAVDCEGLDLSREGKLCVIQVATSKHVFMVDACAFPSDDKDLRLALRSALSFLEDDSILKITFDPRNDSDALYHQLGVTLTAAFDVQLAEVLYSKTYSRPSYVYRFRPNLATCLEKHLPRERLTIERAESFRFMKNGGHDMWADRPLNKVLVKYAVQDVLGSFQVAKILAKGYLLNANSNSNHDERLWRASQTALTSLRDSKVAIKPSKAMAVLPNI